MQIIHDHSYVAQAERKFISRSYACEGLYSLRFSFVCTEAQKAENRAYAEAVHVGPDPAPEVTRAKGELCHAETETG